MPLNRGSGRTAGRYASAARAFILPTAFEQARGGALGAGVREAGRRPGRDVGGSLGAASSESAVGSARLDRGCGRLLSQEPRIPVFARSKAVVRSVRV